MITAAVFDTQPYDREPLQQASAGRGIEWRFLEFRLTQVTAALAKGAQAVCVFVNDQVDRPCLESPAGQSDVISLHIPRTPETRHIIRREILSRMKPGATPANKPSTA